MENIRNILDKVMNTSVAEFVNVDKAKGVKLKAIMDCMKGGDKESKKDISEVTYREFLRKFSVQRGSSPMEMFFSIVQDWEYFRGKSDIWKELTGLNYRKLIETVTELYQSVGCRNYIHDVVTYCDTTRDMMADKEKTLGDYYEEASNYMRKARENKQDFATYIKSSNIAMVIASNNIIVPLRVYAELG